MDADRPATGPKPHHDHKPTGTVCGICAGAAAPPIRWPMAGPAPTGTRLPNLDDEAQGAAAPPDQATLAMALHALLPMDPGRWTVWEPNDFGGGKDVQINSSEFAERLLARLSGAPTDSTEDDR